MINLLNLFKTNSPDNPNVPKIKARDIGGHIDSKTGFKVNVIRGQTVVSDPKTGKLGPAISTTEHGINSSIKIGTDFLSGKPHSLLHAIPTTTSIKKEVEEPPQLRVVSGEHQPDQIEAA